MGLTAGRSGAHGPTGPGVQKVMVGTEGEKAFPRPGLQGGHGARGFFLVPHASEGDSGRASGTSTGRQLSLQAWVPTLRWGGGLRGQGGASTPAK